MGNKKFIIAGTGCALADYLYANVSFRSEAFDKYRSRMPGDGGLSPGKLVFTEELETFAGVSYPKILNELTGNNTPASFNIGGPSIVSLIHAAQMLYNDKFGVKYYGVSGTDYTSERIRKLLVNTPIDFTGYLPDSTRPTPYTHVLSDPTYNNGQGERTFINNIGAAWDLTPNALPDDFFNSDVVCFGGTAITPNLHDNLHHLLEKAKRNGAITFVNTVYDFRNEKSKPGNPWPLGQSHLSFPNIDLLIMDHEEALKISGKNNVHDAFQFFASVVSAFIITRGAEPVLFYSSGKLFLKEQGILDVSAEVTSNIQDKIYSGDTTGCGDNFAGGVLSSLARQLHDDNETPDLKEAVVWGICSGGYTCSYHGGTYLEKERGEKKKAVDKLITGYRNQ
jgi:sugar/nucleoside kinase (ribokinase family)